MSGVALVAYFGYGSLVNRATHRTAIVDAMPARLRGWRRIWRARLEMPSFPAALLSVRREPGSECDGLLVIDRLENLSAVDIREMHYSKTALDVADFDFPSGRDAPDCPIYLYEAKADIPLHREPPLILRSYLDAVMQGFLAEHGEAGLRRFVAETEGFDIGIHEDRAVPRYPRSVALTDAEIALFEALLAQAAHGPSANDKGGSRRTVPL